MSFTVTIEKEELKKTLMEIEEFSSKFPMMKVKNIDYAQLAKYLKADYKVVLSAVALLECMKKMNSEAKERQYYIDLEDMSKMKVKKDKEKWIFTIYKNSKEKMRIKHKSQF